MKFFYKYLKRKLIIISLSDFAYDILIEYTMRILFIDTYHLPGIILPINTPQSINLFVPHYRFDAPFSVNLLFPTVTTTTTTTQTTNDSIPSPD